MFILSSMSLALGDVSVRMLLHGMSEIFLPMLSSRTFMVLRLTCGISHPLMYAGFPHIRMYSVQLFSLATVSHVTCRPVRRALRVEFVSPQTIVSSFNDFDPYLACLLPFGRQREKEMMTKTRQVSAVNYFNIFWGR